MVAVVLAAAAGWNFDAVAIVIEQLGKALQSDSVVLGDGNARLLKRLPPGVRLGDICHAFLGGCRLWEHAKGRPSHPARPHR